MGRAHEVRAASMAKTAAIKSKLYSRYGKELYIAAKSGVPDPEMNLALKRKIQEAKSNQVPADVIKRAIDKVSSGAGEDYETLTYEIFGPAGSTVMVKCLTDNVNRSVSDVRAVVNKCHVKMGAMGSVSYMYDNLCVVGVKGVTEDEVMEALIAGDVDFVDLEASDDQIIVYGNPQDLFKIKTAITDSISNAEFTLDEISLLPKERIDLDGENLDEFNRLISMLDEVDDVQNVYHNVNL